MSKMQDLELIEQMKVGSTSEVMKAQTRLYNKYQGQLTSYINRIFTLEDFEVDSIVAKTFEKAFRKIDTFDDEYSFSTWLLRIGKNTAIDSFRGKKKIQTVSFTNFHHGSEESESRDYDPVDPDSKDDFDLDMEHNYDMQLIEKLLQHLPSERDRQIVRMKYLEDLTHREVSERLSIPMGTIQSIVNKSIKLMQSIAEDYRDDREDNIDDDLINEFYE